MCESCGCEAVPVTEALMMDHTGIAARAARINRALDNGDVALASTLTSELATCLSRHLDVEAAGCSSSCEWQAWQPNGSTS
jgi:hypothetical protein